MTTNMTNHELAIMFCDVLEEVSPDSLSEMRFEDIEIALAITQIILDRKKIDFRLYTDEHYLESMEKNLKFDSDNQKAALNGDMI